VGIKAPTRRAAAVLALTFPAAALVISTACSINDHSNAIANNQHNAANHVIYGQLLTTKCPVKITHAGTNTWKLYGGNDFSELGASTNNSSTPNQE
jgi:hypothetical protein